MYNAPLMANMRDTCATKNAQFVRNMRHIWDTHAPRPLNVAVRRNGWGGIFQGQLDWCINVRARHGGIKLVRRDYSRLTYFLKTAMPACMQFESRYEKHLITKHKFNNRVVGLVRIYRGAVYLVDPITGSFRPTAYPTEKRPSQWGKNLPHALKPPPCINLTAQHILEL